GLSTLLRTSDALRVNRVIGLGHAGGAKAPMIDDLIARYRTAGLKRFSVQLGPGPQLEQIAGWLKARGFARHGGTLLLLRDRRRPPHALAAERRPRRDHRRAAAARRERPLPLGVGGNRHPDAGPAGWLAAQSRAAGLRAGVRQAGVRVERGVGHDDTLGGGAS